MASAGMVWMGGSDEWGQGGPKTLDSLNQEILARVWSGNEDCRIWAANEIRMLATMSSEQRRELADAVEPLVEMLRFGAPQSRVAALLALLKLATKNESNKIKIVDAGALQPIVGFLQSPDTAMQEHAAAAVLTLSAASCNKARISASGALPHLVSILGSGTRQARVDALLALYSFSTSPGDLEIILSAKPIPHLVILLKSCRKSSKTAEKCCALLESLMQFDEARTALTAQEGGVLAVVEALEAEGSPQGREHAVGALLTLCERDRSSYREAILREGAVPGLLELTAQGTPRCRSKAQALLKLLRNSPNQRTELKAETLETIVRKIMAAVDGEQECGEKAVKILAKMVQAAINDRTRHPTCTTPAKLQALWGGPHQAPSNTARDSAHLSSLETGIWASVWGQ